LLICAFVPRLIDSLKKGIPFSMKDTARLSQKDSELRYRRLFEAAQDGILILDAKSGRIEDVNPYLMNMLGYSREEFVKKKLWEVGAFRDIEASQDAFEALQENEYIRYEDLPLKTKDGRLIQVEFVSNVYLVGEEKVIQCNIRDITARRQAEKKLVYQANLLESVNDAIVACDDQYRLTEWNAAAEVLYGWKAAEVLGRNETKIIRTEWPLVDAKRMKRTVAETGRWRGEATQVRKDGTRFPVEVSSLILRDSGETVTGYVSVNHDITKYKLAEATIRKQLQHLTALSAIDRVIASNFDLKINLAEILTHVTTELGVDAADILILNANLQTLEYAAERGFRTKAIRNTQVRLGESYAGRAALERQLVQIQNLRNEPENLFLTTLLKEDHFACYYGVPLISKGQVKGVLEVFHRAVLEPDAEWIEFFKTLAGQAAIAIENSTLFESLQRSNLELTLAYDATIEGWSRALDLRDKETEGHTQRVATMAVKLARAFGLNDADLVQVRWGALLHDIGKMGVPDQVLLKSSSLTEDEWLSMKKHPILAYEMLSPIRYLRLALDIPYYHHEKWDGTGYPHSLKGTQIPLVARIFAVVDVWDALKSDRPYRSAWREEDVYEYIRSASGTHFDPQVVEVFMRLPNSS
jgi:PAS domain S-box-containing protein/putative nucleotidyltransferase with HDIG domain